MRLPPQLPFAADLGWTVSGAEPSPARESAQDAERWIDLARLRRRVRLMLAILLAANLSALAVDVLLQPTGAEALLPFRVAFVIAIVLAWLDQRRDRGNANPILILLVVLTFAACLAAAAVVTGGRTWMFFAVLSAGTVLFLGAMVPWGLWPQVVIVGVFSAATFGVASVSEAAVRVDALVEITVLIGAGISILTAWQSERDRTETARLRVRYWDRLRRLTEVGEHIGAIVWRMAPEGGVEFVGGGYERIWQHDRAELNDRPDAWLEYVLPEYRLPLQEALEAAAHGGDGVVLYRIQRGDGQERWMRDSLFALPGHEERKTYVRLTQDVTSDLEAERVAMDRAVERTASQARAQERARLAQDLHDDLGAQLTRLHLCLSAASHQISGASPETLEALDAAIESTQEALRTLRRVVKSMGPEPLETMGLVAALRAHAEQFEAQTGIELETDLPDSAPELDANVAATLFRIAQESLTNVTRHSGASRCALALELTTSTARLRVEDDGRGIVGAAPSTGLAGMRERAALFGGRVRFEEGPGGVGTIVTAELPQRVSVGSS